MQHDVEQTLRAARVCVSVHACVHACVRACMRACVFVRACVCMCVCKITICDHINFHKDNVC